MLLTKTDSIHCLGFTAPVLRRYLVCKDGENIRLEINPTIASKSGPFNLIAKLYNSKNFTTPDNA